jgi:hypothetical protein
MSSVCGLPEGRPVLYLERNGRSLLTNGEVQPAHLEALIAIATHLRRPQLGRRIIEPFKKAGAEA